MKFIIYSISLLCCPFSLAAQEQEVFNATGGTSIAGGTEVSYSIGEPITTTAIAGTTILTQGLLQPEQAGWTETIDIAGLQWTFRIYPNPSPGYLVLQAETGVPALVNLRMYAADGRLVLTDQLAKGEAIHTLDLKNFSAGWYCLSLIGENGEVVGSLGVVKE